MEQRSTFHDLTLPMDEAMRLRSTSHTTVMVMRFTPDGSQVVSDIRYSPHAVSHVDLDPDQASGESRPAASHLLPGQPLSLDCVLLDVADRASVMAHKLRQCTGDQDITEYPPAPTGDLWGRSRYGQRLYLELLAEMAIDDAFLREVVPGSGVLRGAALVFRTDWRRFAPPGYDLGHALWRAWHPYFMRPFLTASAVSYLVEEGVRGIASDVDDMDCPLRERYRAPRQDHVPPELLHFWSVVDEGIALDWATDEDVEARFASLHRAMREGHVFVVENLRIPPELTDPIHYEGEPSPTGQMVIRGRLHLQPMPWTANSGSVPVQALFRPGVPGGREE